MAKYFINYRSTLVVLALFLITMGYAYAQPNVPITANAAAQIQILMALKEYRTAAQRKIDSQLMLHLQRERGELIANGRDMAPDLRSGLQLNTDRTIEVDIKGRCD